jgi:hypothetical protein
MSADGFHNFGFCFLKKLKNEVFAYTCDSKSRKPPVILKTVPKAGHECTPKKIDKREPRKAVIEI